MVHWQIPGPVWAGTPSARPVTLHMLRAGRVRGGRTNTTGNLSSQVAKEEIVARVKHARDANGTARAGTTLLRHPLPCEVGAISADEMSEDEDHWFVDQLVWGPYQDALGQDVFLARVSGLNDFGQEVNGIIWELQRVDIPPKLIHSFMESRPADGGGIECPPEEWVKEAYLNAAQHLRNYEVEVDDSDSFSITSEDLEMDWNRKARWRQGAYRKRGRRRSSQRGERKSLGAASVPSAVSGVAVRVSKTVKEAVRCTRWGRTAVVDHAGVSQGSAGMSGWETDTGVSFRVDDFVVFKSNDGDVVEQRVGLVTGLGMEGSHDVHAALLVYAEAQLRDPAAYAQKFGLRKPAHWILQTSQRISVPVNNIVALANVACLPFWENSNARSGGFVVVGHMDLLPGPATNGGENDLFCIRPLASGPEERFVWARRLGGGAALALNMVLANVQYRLSLYLESRARADRTGTCDALSLDNVPAHFPYLVLGREWVRSHASQCKFTPTSCVHEVSGTCDDLIRLTGTSCLSTAVSLNCGSDERVADGLLVVQAAGTLPQMTLRWSPRRPGVLLIIFGGFAFYGPEDSRGSRGNPLWSSARNSRAVTQRAAALPTAGLVV
jgi:hypothetical protein